MRGALATLGAIAVLAGLLGAGSAQVQVEPRVFEIADKLRCPVCVSESVAESSSATSVEMRDLIQRKLGEGESEAEILAYFQARYGDWILLTPPRRGIYLVVWLAPAVTGLLFLGLALRFLRRWSERSRVPVQAEPRYLEAVRELRADREA